MIQTPTLPKRPHQKKPRGGPPSREEVVAFIAARGGHVSKRDLVRAFRLDRPGKTKLREMLRELNDTGELTRRRRKLSVAGRLPAVVMSEVTGRDDDGELIAEPVDWDEQEHGPPPRIRLVFGRAAKAGPAPGVGDRVLLRTEESRRSRRPDPPPGPRHQARRESALAGARHLPAPSPGGGGRLVPVDKKSLGRELVVPKGNEGGALRKATS